MKKVLITGANRGIGMALAEKFLKEGYYVYGTSLDGNSPISHANFRISKLDLVNENEIESLIDEVYSLDLLINNAAVMLDEEETTVNVELLRKTMEVNLFGTIYLTEKLISKINQGGHIINISSTAGSLSRTHTETSSHYPYHYPAYKISKASLNMYTRTLAMRLMNEGKKITVSSVHPGWVRTEIGGEDAPISPTESARDIFEFSIRDDIESGHFWYKGEKIEW